MLKNADPIQDGETVVSFQREGQKEASVQPQSRRRQFKSWNGKFPSLSVVPCGIGRSIKWVETCLAPIPRPNRWYGVHRPIQVN